MRDRRFKIAAIVLLIAVVRVGDEALDVYYDVIRIDGDIAVPRLEIGLNLVETGEVCNRFSNVGTGSPQTLSHQMLLNAGPKSFADFAARSDAARLERDVLEDFAVAPSDPRNRTSIDFGFEPPKQPHSHWRGRERAGVALMQITAR